MRSRAGFTVMELMVVVTVMAIIAAIALPALLRARIQANETAAIENLRTVTAAQTQFHNAKNRFGSIAELATEEEGYGSACLDSTWEEGKIKSGYLFTMDDATAGSFLCYADPAQATVSGVRYFRVDTSGVIRWNGEGRPTATDPQIAN